jgi:hypothetical protein
MALEVIGAGFGRTGTMSLKAALEKLGYDPCYHMMEVLADRPGVNEGHVDAWHAHVIDGLPMDWKTLFRGYRATTDFPACLFWREQLEAFPDARVVLSVRDPASWFESFQALHDANMKFETLRKPDERFRKWREFVTRLVWEPFEHARERERCIEIFEAHTAALQAHVPPERLLVFEVRDGWEPLCQFLGKDIPGEPFPRLNQREMMQKMVAAATAREGA